MSAINDPDIAKWLPAPPPDQQAAVKGMYPVAGSCNFGLWRSVFDAVGPWDESYVTGSEDADYCLRQQLAAALPRSLRQLSYGEWLFYAAGIAGRIRGSIRHRVYFI